MPANLTQQYLKAEENYRRAASPEEEVACLQVMLKEIPKHKGTDHLQADLKSKLAKLRKELAAEKTMREEDPRPADSSPSAGTAILLGGPNTGKSQLVAMLTRATPEVAPYPFTTKLPMPAMMPWEDVSVQLIDTPPITADYLDTHLHNLIRAADLALLTVDLGSDSGVEDCQDVLDRLSQTKTRLASKSYLAEEDVGLSYTQTFLVPNKIDAPWRGRAARIAPRALSAGFHRVRHLGAAWHGARAVARSGLPGARRGARLLEASRGQGARPRSSLHLAPCGATLLELAGLVHKDFLEGLKFARVWGSAVHDGTQVKGDYVLHDQDVVELHM